MNRDAQGELAHLEWEDVDFENRLLHVRAKKDWTPKGNEERTNPLTEGAIQALQELWKRNERRKPKSSYVQPGRKGPLKDIRTGLDAACNRAGIPRVPVHGLRHTFGSQLAMPAANPFAIQKAMGHKDIKTTMIYVSLGKSHIREQMERLNTTPLLPQTI